jgi:hypothetical protein
MAISPKEFIDTLSRTGLLSPAEVAALQTEAPTQSAQNGEFIAAELVNRRQFTSYQAAMLSRGENGGLVVGEFTTAATAASAS